MLKYKYSPDLRKKNELKNCYSVMFTEILKEKKIFCIF